MSFPLVISVNCLKVSVKLFNQIPKKLKITFVFLDEFILFVFTIFTFKNIFIVMSFKI